MDPVSAAGLLASIGTLAEGAFKLVSLINTIRQGGKERMQLFTELNSLWMVFKLLQSHFDTEEQEISQQWLDTINVLDEDGGVFDQISTAFDKLTDRLEPKTGHRKVMQNLRWPFDRSEVDELTAHLERLKSTVSLAYDSTNAAVIGEIQSATKYLKLSVANEEVKAIIDWISNLNFLKQQADFRSQARDGTGKWFLDSEEFQQWATSQEAMLWCTGIMGAGKTYLASIAVDYLKEVRKDQNVAVLILYCGYNEEGSQSVDKLVAALIKQILQIRPDVSEDVKKLYREYSRTGRPPPLDKLTSILRTELAKFEDCFIVIDGLDEMLDESKRRSLLVTLSHGITNIMVTFRPLVSIRNLYYPCENFWCDGCKGKTFRFMYHCKQCFGGRFGPGFDLCENCHSKGIRCPEESHYFVKTFSGTLKTEIKATPTDIRNYVEWRIDHEPKLSDSVNKKKNLREEISAIIVQQANEMFLLAKLHMDSLAVKRTPKAVQIALQNLPTDIGDTYDRAIERIKTTHEDDRKIGMNFLLWIAFSIRPLSVPEVEHACAISIGARDFDHDDIVNATELTSMCAELVIVDASDIVRLMHFSAQNYFEEHREKWFLDGHTMLARNCLTYLSYRAFEAGACSGPDERKDFDKKVEQYPLIDYSCSYWGFHARQAQPSVELSDQIFDFVTNKSYLDFAVQAMWYSSSRNLAVWHVKTGAHALHLAAFFGLEQVVTRLLEAQHFVDCRDSSGTTPLMYAAAAGHAGVVQLLLREGANPSLSCQRDTTALHRGSGSNSVDVVRHLLNAPNTDVNAISTVEWAYTPLIVAVMNHKAEIVRMILNTAGLDVNRQCGESKSTALVLASCLDNVQIVRHILNHPDIDVNKRDRWCTPLMRAAAEGYLSMVEALLDHGADPDIQEGDLTALDRAIDNGHVAVVKLLLQLRANPRILDNYNRTIIHKAVLNGQLEVLRVLFNKPIDIDVNAQNTIGRTALHGAARRNCCETIKILFENGARTDIHDQAGLSPLGVAKHMNNLEALELLRKLRKQGTGRDALDNNDHHGRPLKHTQSSIDSGQPSFLTSVGLGMKEAVESYIESSKTDPNVDINLVELGPEAALHIAVEKKHTDIVALLLAAPNVNVNILDHYERSPLHWAAWSAQADTAKLLLDAGADFTLQDRFSETPLAFAFQKRSSTVAYLIMERGAMPREPYMPYALEIAASWGSAGLMERLVREGGADPERKDWEGLTLVKRAEQWGNWKVVDVILRLCEERRGEREKGKGEEEGGRERERQGDSRVTESAALS